MKYTVFHGITLAVALTLGSACSEDGDAGQPLPTEDIASDLGLQFPDTGESDSTPATPEDTAAPPEVNPDTTAPANPCEGVDCGGFGQCAVVAGEALCTCNSGYERDGATNCVPVEACRDAVCDQPNRGVCLPDSNSPAGYVCDCDPGFAFEGQLCVSTDCDGELATTALTVYDMTPLPNVTNPIQDGFDPLLKGDTVRVVTEFRREIGDKTTKLLFLIDNLELDQATVRLNGDLVTPTVLAFNRFEVPIPDGLREGRLAFDGTIPLSGPGLLALDARVTTEGGCRIEGSASGARIQLTGSVDPKHAVCSDLSDLRSLQISTGVPDKNTSVYEQRNGSFAPIGSTYKVLTQMTLCIQRPEGVTVSLSGSADGTRAWTIDNFMLLEVYDGDPSIATTQRIDAWITTSWGAVAPDRYADGSPIKMLSHASLAGDLTGSRSPSPFSFPAGVVQFDRMLPAGQRVWLRITGLDTGVAGHLSHLFVNSAPGTTSVPECRSRRDCPRENSFNGSSTVARSGCIAGRCQPIACSAAAPCAPGQRCVDGFCDESCTVATQEADCLAGQVCGLGGICTDLSAGGCRSFADCPTGEVCLLGRCEAGCFHPVNQNPTYSDNNAQWSLCRLSPAACPRCGDASTRCWNTYCRDCEIDAHCPSGQACRDFRCVAGG